MSDPNDFIQGMPLDELSRFVKDLCHKFGMTDDEVTRLEHMSRAEFDQYLRALEEQMRWWSTGDDPPPGSGREA